MGRGGETVAGIDPVTTKGHTVRAASTSVRYGKGTRRLYDQPITASSRYVLPHLQSRYQPREYFIEGRNYDLFLKLYEKHLSLDCKEVCLAVMPDNERAIRFYKHHGLKEEALFLEKHF